jgi:hypothetical protein
MIIEKYNSVAGTYSQRLNTAHVTHTFSTQLRLDLTFRRRPHYPSPPFAIYTSAPLPSHAYNIIPRKESVQGFSGQSESRTYVGKQW